MSAAGWQRSYDVRFGEIDHAGVMYYPSILDRLHRAFEDFWTEAVGIPYPTLLGHHGIGFPVVDLHVAFRKPFRFGDRFCITLSVLRLGRKSVTFRYRIAAQDGEARAEAEIVTGVIAMDGFRPVELPEHLAAVLRPFLDEPPGA